MRESDFLSIVTYHLYSSVTVPMKPSPIIELFSQENPERTCHNLQARPKIAYENEMREQLSWFLSNMTWVVLVGSLTYRIDYHKMLKQGFESLRFWGERENLNIIYLWLCPVPLIDIAVVVLSLLGPSNVETLSRQCVCGLRFSVGYNKNVRLESASCTLRFACKKFSEPCKEFVLVPPENYGRF